MFKLFLGSHIMVDDGQRASTRRRFLGGTASVAAMLAGCAGGGDESGDTTARTTSTQDGTATGTSTTTGTATETETAAVDTGTNSSDTGGTGDVPVRGPTGEPLSVGAYHSDIEVKKAEENINRELKEEYNPLFHDQHGGRDILDPESVEVWVYDAGETDDGRPEYGIEIWAETHENGPFTDLSGYQKLGDGLENDEIGAAIAHMDEAALPYVYTIVSNYETPAYEANIFAAVDGAESGLVVRDEWGDTSAGNTGDLLQDMYLGAAKLMKAYNNDML
jgi:hypothetical protein